MNREIDLIPASYKERLKIKRWCHLFLAALIIVILSTVLLKTSINRNLKTTRMTINKLQHDKSFNLQQQQKFNDLLTVERRLTKNLEILKGLRGGPPVREILMVINRVLNDNIWFSHWSFLRAGEFSETKPKTVQKGYIIIIPKENSDTGKEQTWKLETHMEIKGQAKDHSSFSAFIENLLNQPEIEDVTVISTQERRYLKTQVIDFNIIIFINNQYSKPHV